MASRMKVRPSRAPTKGSRRVLISTGRGGFVSVVRDSKKHKALVCKAQGGHTFDGPDDPNKCINCDTRRATPKTFARLAYIKWWDDSMRRTWRSIGVEMLRPAARDVMRALLEDENHEVDWRDEGNRQLCDAAMVDHKLRHPQTRGDRLWSFGNPTGRGRADVVCRFCRRVLEAQVRIGFDYSTNDVMEHVVSCAISALATGASSEPTTRKGKG